MVLKRLSMIVISYAVQVIVFGLVPTLLDLLGAAITLVTVLSIPLEPVINKRLCPANTSEDEESILGQE